MDKKNLIFDLYETLIDIRTDENSLSLWRVMAQLYSRCGAVYRPKELQQAYCRMVGEEEAYLREKTGLLHPEIQLETVFQRLLDEAPAHIPADRLGTPAVLTGTGMSALTSANTSSDVLTDKLENASCTVTSPVSPDSHLETTIATTYDCPASEPKTIGAGGHGDTDPLWLYMIANTFRSMSMRRFRLFPGTIQTMEKLRREGYRLFLLSNAQAIFTKPELEMTRLIKEFDAVYISSEKGMKKPQKEFMQLLLDEQGLDPESCMMIGNDTESDLGVALPCGVTGCLLNTYHLSDDEIERRFASLHERFPGAQTVAIRSGCLTDLPELLQC